MLSLSLSLSSWSDSQRYFLLHSSKIAKEQKLKQKKRYKMKLKVIKVLTL